MQTHKPVDRPTHILRVVVAAVLGVIVLAGAAVGALYAMSPAAIRQPTSAHYHLRMQVVVEGKLLDFSEPKYQTEFNKDICSAKLTREPFHFHDNLSQFVHVHWAGMTGGLLLKHYGWGTAGGLPGVLGYRFDSAARLAAVPIHGAVLPRPSTDAKYFVYTGTNEADYRERSWPDFQRLGLEDFFASKSAASASWLDRIIPTALAHGGESHSDESHGDSAKSEAELIQLNHVVGNVVIFAQKTKPTEQQIKDRFANLVPLPESSCGG